MPKKENDKAISVPELEMRTVRVGLIGLTGYVSERMSQKAKMQLLSPPKRKTREVDRLLAPPKHNPIEEYRDSVHRLTEGPCLIGLKAAGIKRAMATAALDLPGAKKAQISRLIWVPSDRSGLIPLYGIPELWMTVVRMADMSHTPDIRTRAALPRWACIADVQYVYPLIHQSAVLRLLSAAGRMVGLGGGRQEKGALDFGQFELVEPDGPAVLEIIESSGREAQEAALEEPLFYDVETAELFATWAPREEEVAVAVGRDGGTA